MSVQAQHLPGMPQHVSLLGKPLSLLRQYKRSYIALNVFYYGVILLGMGYAVLDPALQQEVLRSAGIVFTQGPLGVVGDAYLNNQILPAVALTFGINLGMGSFGTITLPSLVIPFSGLLMGAYRAFLWGLIYAPTSPQLQIILLPHSVTLLLEGQAYILTMFAVIRQGLCFLFPKRVGLSSHIQGLWLGIKQSAQIYILVIIVLAVAAVYEVIESAILLTTLRP